ncbi:MAG: hypothetical protein ACI4VN_04930 [Clostridia bacterium]|nr:hypothetical protein [Clostridia bacterium]
MKILKNIIVVITTLIIIIAIEPEVKAITFDDMKSKIDTFMGIGQSKGDSAVNGDDMKKIIVPIANILTAIGVFVLVGVTIVMGIKYMFATPEEAAKLKQQLIGLVVSAVVVLGATAVWKIVYNVLTSTGL